jgi:oligoendopeptidase F
LASRRRERGAPCRSPERYAAGTKHYSELLRPFGLDAMDPKFWDGGLSVIAGMIDEQAMG